jgi:hypothetical protein
MELLAGDQQALLACTPYLLIVLAPGAREWGRRKVVAVPLAAALISLFVVSSWYFHKLPPRRDYRALAGLINARLQHDDAIFVRPRQRYVTPLSYYVDSSRLVAGDYAAFAARRPNARAWVVLFEKEGPTAEISAATAGFHLKDEVTAMGARALLYERTELSTGPPSSGYPPK